MTKQPSTALTLSNHWNIKLIKPDKQIFQYSVIFEEATLTAFEKEEAVSGQYTKL
jgi:hypothetical protein